MRHTACSLALILGLSLLANTAAAQTSADASAVRQSYRLEAAHKYRPALKAIARTSPTFRLGYFFSLRRGWLLYLVGQYTDSATAYERASRKAPTSLEPLLGRMLPLMALRRWKDAAAAGQQVLRTAPHNYLASSRVAWCDYNLGRFSRAAKRYRRLVQQYPANVEMRAGLGWALLKQKRKVAARREFELVITISPDHATARTGLALSKTR